MNGNVPTAVGCPENCPFVPRVSPAGSAPLVTLQVYGAVPPVAARVEVYEAFSVALANVAVSRRAGHPG